MRTNTLFHPQKPTETTHSHKTNIFAPMQETETPLISIIMAVRNNEPYMHTCLDSILAQEYVQWELIAVNDGSEDRTSEILHAYASRDARIRVIDKEHSSLLPTLRAGYAQAKGTLVHRMDSDDRMPLYKLRVMVEEWRKHGKGTLVTGGTQHFVEDGEIGDGFRRYDEWLCEVARTNAHLEQIYRECVIPSSCWLMHREDFDRAGAFNSDVFPEDYDLTFRLYKSGIRIVGLPMVFHFWRDRSDRISRTWEVYKDNRYYGLKVERFLDIDYDPQRPLVIWGAGKNGKDLVKTFQDAGVQPAWVCDNVRKVGKDIYGIRMQHIDDLPSLASPQILIAVASPDDQVLIKEALRQMGKEPIKDYWFFN